jgi:hypothetical protein
MMLNSTNWVLSFIQSASTTQPALSNKSSDNSDAIRTLGANSY